MDPNIFFSNPHPQDISVPMDIAYSISLLRENGHKVQFIDTRATKMSLEALLDKINYFNPQIIGIQSTTPTADLSLKLAQNVKNLINPLIFAFGQHATAQPRTFIFEDSPIDICIRGEPELTIKDLVFKYSKKENLHNILSITIFNKGKTIDNPNREPIGNLDKLPFPSHDFFLNGNYKLYYPVNLLRVLKWGFILGSRGCMHSCIFCSPTLRVSYGKKLRSRSPTNIVDEMRYLISKGVNAIHFVDDNFMSDITYVESLCDEIIKRKIRVAWVAQTRVDNISEKVLQKMRKAGCSTLCMGVESGSERILKILGKGISRVQIKKAFDLCKKAGLLTVGYFMIGNPTETKKEIEESIQFCKKLKPDLIQVAFFTPYPGSPYFEKLNNTKKKQYDHFSHYNKPIFNFSKVKNLKKIQKSFYKRYYFSPSYLIKHLFKRIPFMLLNFKEEYKLISNTLMFLFDNHKRKIFSQK